MAQINFQLSDYDYGSSFQNVNHESNITAISNSPRLFRIFFSQFSCHFSCVFETIIYEPYIANCVHSSSNYHFEIVRSAAQILHILIIPFIHK